MVLNVILSLSFRHYCGQTLIVALNRGKVIFEGRKLRIRASCITVRSNSSNSCLKLPQIDVRNLETHKKCCIFAVLKRITDSGS